MTNTEIPVNRTLVGCLAVGCLVIGGLLEWLVANDAAGLWTGAFVRVGVVLAALWLALPSRTREAAWARVPLWKVLGTAVGLLLIIRSRIPFQLLIPAGILFGIIWIVLRPRPPRYPSARFRS
ncbi:hypothetical protein GC163_02420 [bacterium]|nr:hypothetical protein [bacterium]